MTSKHNFNIYLEPIQSWQNEMQELLIDWCATNSYSGNSVGLVQMAEKIASAFEKLEGICTIVDCCGAPALSIKKRPQAPMQVLLAGHFDTVFPLDSGFVYAKREGGRIHGPGAADMKGGIVILLYALLAFENSPYATNLGWEVFLNPDEETGSLGSKALYYKKAECYDLGLVYEPAFSDGNLVSSRKAIANAFVHAKGRSAHAGRDFHKGKNAVVGLSKLVYQIDEMNRGQSDLTINIGSLHGGKANNIVPDTAVVGINMRASAQETLREYLQKIKELTLSNSKNGLSYNLEIVSHRPPKTIDNATEKTFNSLCACATELGLNLSWKPSGGGSDASFLADGGLITLDTLGPVGGGLHTLYEYIEAASLKERASLSALFLMKIASGEICLPKKG